MKGNWIHSRLSRYSRIPYLQNNTKIQNPKSKILIAPLDWGLGHATRCIPIIRYLLESSREVVIASDGRPEQLLRLEFPMVGFVSLRGYQIKYPADGWMATAMLRQLPKIYRAVRSERRWLQKYVTESPPDLIISDNRFGLWCPTVHSVYITHQLTIRTSPAFKWAGPILKWFHSQVISNFTECWIPDYEERPGLAGELSHPGRMPGNAYFIGPLSRFVDARLPQVEGRVEAHSSLHTRHSALPFDLLAVLSGPEPQRSIFEEIILKQLPATGLRALVVEGRTENNDDEWITDRVRKVSSMPSLQLDEAFRKSSVVLCRPGYSSVMDLAALGKPAIFVPTPGQTEQEYLAEQLSKSWGSVVMSQKSFDLAAAWKSVKSRSGPLISPAPSIGFADRIEALLAGAQA